MMAHAACTAAAARPSSAQVIIRPQQHRRRSDRLVARAAAGGAGDAEAVDDVDTEGEAVAAEGEVVAVEAEAVAETTTAVAAETVVKPKKKKKKKVRADGRLLVAFIRGIDSFWRRRAQQPSHTPVCFVSQAKTQTAVVEVEVRAESPMLPAALQGIPMDRLAFMAIAGVGALGYGIYKLATRPKMPRPSAPAVSACGSRRCYTPGSSLQGELQGWRASSIRPQLFAALEEEVKAVRG
jgi:hypothetical protein